MKYPEFKCPRCGRILKPGDWQLYSYRKAPTYMIECRKCGAYKKWTQETEKQPHTWNPGPSTTSKRNRGADMGI